MNSLRRALRPERGMLRGFLLSLLGVGAVVVGLLAMHSFNLDNHSSAGAVVVAETVLHHHGDAALVADRASHLGYTASNAETAASDHCSGLCGHDHAMTAMACILALLVPLLMLGRTRVVNAWRAAPLVTAMTLDHLGALPLPEPPFLHALSISRT